MTNVVSSESGYPYMGYFPCRLIFTTDLQVISLKSMNEKIPINQSTKNFAAHKFDFK